MVACDVYHVQRIAALLQPIIRSSIGSAANTVCVLVDAPFADPRLAPLASVDPRFLQGLLTALPSRAVTVAARSLPGFPTRFTLRRGGYGALARSGVPVQPLEEADHYQVTARSSGATLHVPIAYLGAAVRVVVTRVKTGVLSHLCLSAWTLLSLLPDAQRPADSDGAAARIADLLDIAPPHLVVLDAIEAGHDGNELTCRPKTMGTMIVAGHSLAADLAVATAIGVPLEHLPYLQRAGRDLDLRGDLTLDAVRARSAGLIFPPARPDALPLSAHVRVVVGDGAAGNAGLLTIALQVMERAGGFAGARETTLVVGRTQQEQRTGSDQAALVFIGDSAAASYRGFSRVARIRGAPVRLRALLNDLPFIMRLPRPLDPLLIPLTAAAARSSLTRLVRRPRVILYPEGR